MPQVKGYRRSDDSMESTKKQSWMWMAAPLHKESERGISVVASATTTISRADYGMNYDAGMIGDQVAIQLDVELVDKAPGGPRQGGPPPTPPPAAN